MPRFSRIDKPVTALLLRNGLLKDKRSFVGHGTDMVPHLYLKGVDMSEQREKCRRRDKGICQVCGKYVLPSFGEPHHILSRGKGGSDDIDNLQWRCSMFAVSPCHRNEHVQTQSVRIKREEAVKDFNRVQGDAE